MTVSAHLAARVATLAVLSACLIHCSDAGQDTSVVGRDAGDEDDVGPSLCGACLEDELCIGGRCIAAPPCGCSFGEYCVDSLCMPGCVSNVDCGLGSACEAGSCVPFCASSLDCATFDDCVDGQCRMRCALNDECGLVEACVEGVCADVECRNDRQCGRGARCEDFSCSDVGDAPCASGDECGFGWSCDAGSCVECQADEDCTGFDVCIDRACASPPGLPLVFVMRDPGPLGAHGQSALPNDDFFGYGSGFALADLDGDLDLDVVLAGQSADDRPVCAYRNVSEVGAPRFEPIAPICDLGLRGYGLTGADVDGDGTDEFFVLGPESVVLVAGDVSPSATTLLSPTDGVACLAGVALPYDLDADGDLDLVVGCSAGVETGLEDIASRANLVFLQDEQGRWTRWDDRPAALANDGVALALGVIDFDEDGLWDIVIANDTYSAPERPNFELEPMAIARPCSPLEDCAFDAFRVHEGNEAWGAFMGVASLWSQDQRWAYVTDVGQNNLFLAQNRPQLDASVAHGVGLADRGGLALVAWSALVDDYDGDGDDDMLVTHGMFPNVDASSHLLQVPAIALQGPDGMFATWLGGFGMTEPTDRPSTSTDFPAQTRAGMRADFDHDGVLDVLTVQYVGYPELYSEQSDAFPEGRCTIVPRAHVVRTHGFGFGVSPERDGPYRQSHVQGHLRSGDANQVLSATRAGWLAFPSGAHAPFACDDGAFLTTVAEPDWLQAVSGPSPGFRIDGDVLREGSVTAVSAAVRNGSGQVDQRAVRRDPQADLWVVDGLASGDHVMLMINGRWVWRWFEL